VQFRSRLSCGGRSSRSIGFPPDSPLRQADPPTIQADHKFVPAVGAALKPNTTYQLMLVVRIQKASRWTFPSYDLVYELDGKK
jgi:hypothetical protein